MLPLSTLQGCEAQRYRYMYEMIAPLLALFPTGNWPGSLGRRRRVWALSDSTILETPNDIVRVIARTPLR